MEMLKDKVALITGAARGIGKAIALKYASEGANIAFTDLVINEAAEETVKELEAFGVTVKAYASNAAEFEATQTVVDQVVKDFGRIDILVNNAGITKDGLVMRMSEQQWDAVIAVNMKSAFNFLHAVVPVMARQRSGSIINMASIAGQTGNPGQVNYSASKAGLIAMAKSVAKEMGSRGIRANAIAPGYVISEMTEALPQSVRDEFVKMIPLGRGASVDEIASVALFLASDLASYVTGQVIAVNGGMYC
ncbi:MAG: 3-oxoacyl-[Bacteroidales bacterium]|nr:3-oxoacyl-[acyl-carrier-protein] reductase [Bacteroidales bacterium]MBR3989950.1 3-oxoacyl-[acyl-carrier-protein] reductase [Bacteroidales bacterium]